MIIELIVAMCLGIAIGTATGLFPGIHINLVAAILLSISPILLAIFPPIALVVFIVSLTTTHIFVDFIPSIVLGAPNEDNFLSVLPGHKLLLEGNGHSAILISIYGALTGILVLYFFTPIFIIFLPSVYPYFERIMWIILILSSGYLIYSEKNKKLLATVVFLLAGFLGIASLNLNLKEPLLPLLTGLFGGSSLIISIKEKTKIPIQNISNTNDAQLSKNSFFKTTFSSIIASPLPAFLPGMGSSQAALIGSQIQEKITEKEFLFLIGIIGTVVTGLSFITFYSIEKARTGSAVAISKLIPNLSFSELLIIITSLTISSLLAFIVTLNLSKIILKKINKINYSNLSFFILLILISIVLFFSSFLGFLVFITGTFLGVFCILSNIKRIHLMGCLLVPTILFYVL
jgi:putative membrane protein